MGKRISPARARAHAAVEHDMEEATIEGARPLCWQRPELFADYRTEEEPGVAEAQQECVDHCPLRRICKRKAQLERPAWGIWAGDVWEGETNGTGRIVRHAPKPATLTA